ncbi:hypothetical protein D1872_316220 [compost metagenome]
MLNDHPAPRGSGHATAGRIELSPKYQIPLFSRERIQGGSDIHASGIFRDSVRFIDEQVYRVFYDATPWERF